MIVAGKVSYKMGILKKEKLYGIRMLMVALLIMIILFASAAPVQAASGHLSEKGNDGGTVGSEKDENPTGEYHEERIEEIPYKTLYKYSSELAGGDSRIETAGELGTKKVVGKVIIQNGAIVERQEVSTTIIKKPVDEIILIGSLWDLPDMNYTFEDEIPILDVSYDSSVYVNLPEESKGGKSGQEIIEFAMQFLGTPYVWGGSSLTWGCDCSGFVYSVFNACGYDVPRNGVEYVYPISMDELKPGDVISYPDHYTIYIGNGMEIGALNWRYGVCITPVGYVSGYYNAVRIAEDK